MAASSIFGAPMRCSYRPRRWGAGMASAPLLSAHHGGLVTLSMTGDDALRLIRMIAPRSGHDVATPRPRMAETCFSPPAVFYRETKRRLPFLVA